MIRPRFPVHRRVVRPHRRERPAPVAPSPQPARHPASTTGGAGPRRVQTSTPAGRHYNRPRPLAFWVCAAVTAISATVSLGYSIAGLVAAGETDRTASMYALARSVVLAVVAVAAIFIGSVPFLTAVAVAMVVVQAADAVVGRFIRDRLKTIGPAATAADAPLAALIWLCTSA